MDRLIFLPQIGSKLLLFLFQFQFLTNYHQKHILTYSQKLHSPKLLEHPDKNYGLHNLKLFQYLFHHKRKELFVILWHHPRGGIDS